VLLHKSRTCTFAAKQVAQGSKEYAMAVDVDQAGVRHASGDCTLPPAASPCQTTKHAAMIQGPNRQMPQYTRLHYRFAAADTNTEHTTHLQALKACKLGIEVHNVIVGQAQLSQGCAGIHGCRHLFQLAV
jgi:hypothetical protein